MKPNAAMQTALPTVPSSGLLRHLTGSELMSHRPTSLMVHVAGYGPRRIYRGDRTNRYFYLIDKRRVEVNIRDILRLLNPDIELEAKDEQC